jgi:hypothetical protein
VVQSVGSVLRHGGQFACSLLTGAEAEVDAHPERCHRTAMNRVCEAFELVKETRERDLENSPTSIISPTDYCHPSLTTA